MLLDALDKLNPFVRRGLEILSRHREEKPRCHILNLPDEVLTVIFKFTSVIDQKLFEPGPPDFDSNLIASSALPLILSSTCRQFRRVALACPTLWAIWHNTDFPGSFVLPQRRGGRPLTIYVDAHRPIRNFPKTSYYTVDDILEMSNFDLQRAYSLFQYPSDIKSLIVERSKGRRDVLETPESSRGPKNSWKAATFPSLEELSIKYADSLHENGGQLFDDWVMPLLHRLSILNSVPKDHSSLAFGTSLTSLQLVFTKSVNADFDYVDISLPDLVHFISKQQSLAELSIRFDIGIYQNIIRPTQPAILPSLKSFQLYLGEKHSRSIVEYLLQALEMSSLRNFLLTVDCDIEELAQVAFYVLDGISSSSEIQDFHLRFVKSSTGLTDLSTTLPKMQSLRNLSISSPDDADRLCSINMDQILLTIARDLDGPEPSSFPLPFLESIRLRGNAFSPTFLQSLLALAAKDPKHLDQIKEVVLQNCSCFEKNLERIYRIIPRDRVIWLDELSTL